jgi:hypothetical protein
METIQASSQRGCAAENPLPHVPVAHPFRFYSRRSIRTVSKTQIDPPHRRVICVQPFPSITCLADLGLIASAVQRSYALHFLWLTGPGISNIGVVG